MGKGFGGMPGNMQAIMKQAQEMQQKLQEAQAEAETMTEEGSSGGGMVKVVAKGDNSIESIVIDPSVVDPNDIEMLQDLITAAVNAGLQKVQGSVKKRLEGAAGGMSIPGLF